jgi:hypothetical protein
MVGGFTGRWPPLSEMGKLGNLMTWGLRHWLRPGLWSRHHTVDSGTDSLGSFCSSPSSWWPTTACWCRGASSNAWKEGHAFYFNLELYGVYCALTVAVFWAAPQLFH